VLEDNPRTYFPENVAGGCLRKRVSRFNAEGKLGPKWFQMAVMVVMAICASARDQPPGPEFPENMARGAVFEGGFGFSCCYAEGKLGPKWSQMAGSLAAQAGSLAARPAASDQG